MKKIKLYLSSAILISITLLTQSACSGNYAATVKNNICPPPVIPSQADEELLIKHTPEFYLDYANLVNDLLICRTGESPIE